MIDYTVTTRFDHRYASNCASLTQAQLHERLDLEALKWTEPTVTSDVAPLSQAEKHVAMFHLIGS